jgi:hypothetical protein
MNNEENFLQFTELRLGISDIDIELLTRADTCHATDLIIQQSEESLEIFSRELDPELYDREPFLDAVSSLCVKNRKARIRILVQDPAPAIKRSHRLIELSRRISSSIEMRQPHPDYQHHNEAFLIADHCGLITRGFADRYEGTANFYSFTPAQRKLDFFTEVWDHSEVHPEFRRLHI